MENLEDMAVFARVVARGSFTAAGRELRKTTSSVSKHIARLERALSTKLFHRSTHHLVLTEAGARFHDRCVRILGEIEEARAEVSAASDGMSGVLRVHASPGVGQSVVAAAAIAVGQKYPDLQVELAVGDFATTIMRRGVDVLIASRPFTPGEEYYSSLMAQDLGPAPYAICASPDFLAREGRPAEPRDLAQSNCLVHLTQKKDPHAWEFGGPGPAEVVRVTGRYRSNLEFAVQQAARDGLGIARLPLYTVKPDLEAGALVELFPGRILSDRTIKAFTPRSDALPQKVRALIDEVTARLAGG